MIELQQPYVLSDAQREAIPVRRGIRWAGLAFSLYLGAMLGLAGFVAWKVAHPLPHLLP